jgi:hypothetical protein
MRPAAIMLVFLIAIVFVSASTLPSQYIVVIGERAPASDAVIGANFAASMKASVGVTFSSALDTQLYETITEQELASKTIVVIDGESRKVRILGTSSVVEVANTYFTRQGFTVDEVTSPDRVDVLLQPPITAPVQIIPEDIIEEPIDARIEDSQTPVPSPDEAVEEPTAPAVPPVAEPETPGLLKRVWQWFAGWF